MKAHLNEEQFDGQPHPWCGRGSSAVPSAQLEATPSHERCLFCEREWFPNGQPASHFQHAVQKQAVLDPKTE